MLDTPTSLTDGARQVLTCGDPEQKALMASALAQGWAEASFPLQAGASIAMPDRPARPERPQLMHPRDMPRRTFKGPRGRFALLHALAHIELNAVDLAIDIAGRFVHEDLPRDFFTDWMSVAADEARHFLMLQTRLRDLGGQYGDLPAHDSLWQSAEESRHDLLIRLAIVPLVLEARGLDVTPLMITKLQDAGDEASTAILRVILEEEERHVRIGMKWFRHMCQHRAEPPHDTFHRLVRKHFRGALKPPFNETARRAAGMEAAFYHPLAK